MMTTIRISAFACALIAVALCAPALAQNDMVIYRCVDAKGAVTLQNDVPCPKESQQTVRKLDALQPLPILPATAAPTLQTPAAPAARPAVAVPDATPAAPAPVLVRQPPPPVFQCRSWDERDYLSDIGEPPPTCTPVRSVGIDGSTILAAGQTCEMRQDTCTPVADDALCATWKKRMDEAEFRWKFSGSGNDERKAEFERIARVYRGSTCLR